MKSTLIEITINQISQVAPQTVILNFQTLIRAVETLKCVIKNLHITLMWAFMAPK